MKLQIQSIIIFIKILISQNAEFHEIVTKFGTIKGLVETNILNDAKYYAYRGIPYAKKITEETKFRDSKPVEPWRGILNATKFGNNCISVTRKVFKVTGDLDCLYLNVYVPTNYNSVEPLSTLFFIYGGGFLYESGDDYGPDYLIREGVILVTINYRLGPIGFLNLKTASCPGNMALKDQSRALKFYKEVIAEAVGGDPNSITISGGSSGAASVSYHTLSPMSKGLFKRAILESGSSLDVWAYDNNLEKTFEKSKKIFNLTSNDPEKVAQELTDRPAREIVKNFGDYLSKVQDASTESLTFVPSKEKKIEGVEQFLSDTPHNIMFDGTYDKVPLLIGVNSDDGISISKAVRDCISDEPVEFIKSYPQNISYLFKDFDLACRQIYKNYTRETTDLRNSLFLDDLLFFFNTWITMNLFVEYRIPIYSFYFQYRTTSESKRSRGITEPACAHGDQVFYFFYKRQVKNKYSPGTTNYNLMSKFTKTWTSFVRTGNPTPKGSGPLRWEMYNQEGNVMKIDEDFVLDNILTLEKGFNSRMCYILSFMKNEIQNRFKPLEIC